jgi:hypothetical protein
MLVIAPNGGRKAPKYGAPNANPHESDRAMPWQEEIQGIATDRIPDRASPDDEPGSFRALSLAIHNLSVRELELCSPRRLLTSVSGWVAAFTAFCQ